jgi:hypothetical protein
VLNHSVLSYDVNGRIRNTVSAPTHYVAGVPFNGPLLCISLNAPVRFHNGQGYVASGRLSALASTTLEVTHFSQGGLPMNATNQVAFAASGVVTSYNHGLPYDASRLSFSAAE